MTARRILVVLLLATMLASCTGGDGDNPDSGDDQAEGASTVGPITLTVPKGWTEDPKAEERNEDAAWVAPLGDGDTVAPQGVNVVVSKAAGDIEQAYQSMPPESKQLSPASARRGGGGRPRRRGRRQEGLLDHPGEQDRPEATLFDLLAVAEDGTQCSFRLHPEPPTDAEPPTLCSAALPSRRERHPPDADPCRGRERVFHAGGAFLAAMLILVSVSGSSDTDSGRLLVSLVIAWCRVAFLATFFARRRAERSTPRQARRTDDPLLPLAAMAGRSSSACGP